MSISALPLSYCTNVHAGRSVAEVEAGLDRYTVGGPVPYQLAGRRARGVGGSTLHWEGYALRMHASDFRLLAELVGIAGRRFPIVRSDEVDLPDLPGRRPGSFRVSSRGRTNDMPRQRVGQKEPR